MHRFLFAFRPRFSPTYLAGFFVCFFRVSMCLRFFLRLVTPADPLSESFLKGRRFLRHFNVDFFLDGWEPILPLPHIIRWCCEILDSGNVFNKLFIRTLKVLRGLVKNAIIFFLCVKLIEFTFYDEIYIAILHHSSPINRMCCVCVMKRFDCGNDLNCSVKFNFVQICPAYIYI